MGAVKSFTHAFTWSEYLFWYIQRKDIPHIEQVLSKKPQLINSRISVHYSTTPLHRAANNGNLQLVKLFVQKYGAVVDTMTDNGETALIAAIKRDHISIVRYLVAAKASPQFKAKSGLFAYQFAVLNGQYEIAQFLLEHCDKPVLRTSEEYEDLRVRYRYRYVNYHSFLQGLKDKIPIENMTDFLTFQKKLLDDPVVDPRETWKHWIKRMIQFKDPPLVERKDLPFQLQPQNRRFGKIRHFFSKHAMSKLSQKPNYQSQTRTEVANQTNEEKNTEMQIHSVP